jgi:hypothetical protein
MATYFSIAQLNFPFPNAYPTAYPLQVAVNHTLAAKTPGEVLRVPLLAKSWSQEPACIDLANSNITVNNGLSVIGDSFSWIKCTFFPLSFGTGRPGSMFPHRPGPYGDCARTEWQTPDWNSSNIHFQRKYSTTDENLDQTTRLLIIQGSYDIATGFGSPNLTLTSDREHSRFIYVQGMAHTEDSFSELVEPRGMKTVIDQV